MIKLVTASAAMGMLINPVLGAITALGGLAASKRATQNERKYILSEIDIELKGINWVKLNHRFITQITTTNL